MMFFFINLLISFFIFLFCLYLFSKDDFILLRKNVTLEEMFNYAFVNGLIALSSARVFYIIFHPAWKYLNPLIFLIFIYFPGLSLTGAVIGTLIFLFFLSQRKKIPRGRIYDIFSLSFLPAVVFNIIFSQVLMVLLTRKFSLIILGVAAIFLVVFIIATIIFRKDKAKDGVISSLIMSIFAVLFILNIFIPIHTKKSILLDKEAIILAMLFLLGIILFVRQKILRRRR